MLQTLAVQNYRTLRDFVIPLSPLNLITGANGSGQSNIYKALRLMSETAQGGVIGSLAREGGLDVAGLRAPVAASRQASAHIFETHAEAIEFLRRRPHAVRVAA